MISKEQLVKIARKTNLHLYQQEKDYLLKVFLFNYYRKFNNAIFKGGTCLRYLYGLNRFSEDLDFNLLCTPKKFEKEVGITLKEMGHWGIESRFRKVESFKDAFTCEIEFRGPLFNGTRQSLNKFRIDSGKRTGIFIKPRWELISSEYADTPENFLVRVLDERELLAEKLHALCNRKKGRDLYDVWFLIKRGTHVDKNTIRKKLGGLVLRIGISREQYARDMNRLLQKFPDYEQVVGEVEKFIEEISE